MYNHLILSYNYNILLNVQQQDQNGYPNQIQTLQQSWPATQWKVKKINCQITIYSPWTLSFNDFSSEFLKLVYSERAFFFKSPNYRNYLLTSKWIRIFFFNFVAFSGHINFNLSLLSRTFLIATMNAISKYLCTYLLSVGTYSQLLYHFAWFGKSCEITNLKPSWLSMSNIKSLSKVIFNVFTSYSKGMTPQLLCTVAKVSTNIRIV